MDNRKKEIELLKAEAQIGARQTALVGEIRIDEFLIKEAGGYNDSESILGQATQEIEPEFDSE